MRHKEKLFLLIGLILTGSTVFANGKEGDINNGGALGYLADISIANTKTMIDVVNNKELLRDFNQKQVVGERNWDLKYINNSHNLGGLLDVDYDERSVFGLNERRVSKNSTMGVIYGGGRGKASFGEYGRAKLDLGYFGAYYDYEFNKNLSLLSNMRLAYQFNSVDRYVGGKVYNSTSPTYGFGVGTQLNYEKKIDDYRLGAHAGVSWTKVVQGNLYEGTDGLGVAGVNEGHFDSWIPNVGVSLAKRGYVFDKKYILGAGIEYETELGNIKNEKKITKSKYVKTMTGEDILSYSVFGKLNVTEDLAFTGAFTKSESDDYDTEKYTIGTEYKFNEFNIPGLDSLQSAMERRAQNKSERWRHTVAFQIETEDDSDRIDSKTGLPANGYKTSTSYIPKLMYTLTDTQSKWSYYFEGYYRDNDMFQGRKDYEGKHEATRLHGEARWNDKYSMGTYGISIGYRNERVEQERWYNTSKNPLKNGFNVEKNAKHQLRITPRFTLKLSKDFTFTASSAQILEYYYLDNKMDNNKKHQMDYITETEAGLIYSGFMPKVNIRATFFKEYRRYDGEDKKNEKYHLTQFRPTITYYLENGSTLALAARIPLNGGLYYKQKGTEHIANFQQESRYGITYTHNFGTGLYGYVGMEMLLFNEKNREVNKSFRWHSFRPKAGFRYSF